MAELSTRIGSGAFQVRGLEQLKQALAGVEEAVRKKVIRKASYKASRIVIAEIRRLIEAMGLVDTGAMKKRLGAKVITRKASGQVVLIVGSLRTPGKTRDDRAKRRAKLKIQRDPFYIRFQEFGTENIPAHRFVEQAFINTRQAYTDLFVEECRIELAKVLLKLKSKRR